MGKLLINGTFSMAMLNDQKVMSHSHTLLDTIAWSKVPSLVPLRQWKWWLRGHTWGYQQISFWLLDKYEEYRGILFGTTKMAVDVRPWQWHIGRNWKNVEILDFCSMVFYENIKIYLANMCKYHGNLQKADQSSGFQGMGVQGLQVCKFGSTFHHISRWTWWRRDVPL